MKLGGQGELRRRQRFGGQGGYAMASLLVAMALMAVFMSVALPAWTQMAQREKEAEYLFRANQYALAIRRFQIKTGQTAGQGQPAPSVDFLVEQKFLRKKYKDPLTGKDFVPVLNSQALPPGGAQQAGQAGQRTGQQPGRPGEQSQQQQQQSSLATAKSSLAVDTLRVSASTPGGSDSARPLTGVTSSSKATALRLFKGQATTYDQWAVTSNDLGLRLGGTSVGSRFVQAGGVGTPQQPGQPPGQGQNPFQGQSPFQGGNTPRPGGTGSPFGGGSGFGSPNQQGTPVFPQQPFGGGTGQKPPSAPFGSKPPI